MFWPRPNGAAVGGFALVACTPLAFWLLTECLTAGLAALAVVVNGSVIFSLRPDWEVAVRWTFSCRMLGELGLLARIPGLL